MKSRKLLIVIFGFILPMSSQALVMNVDEILFEGDASTDSSVLSGTVEMNMSDGGGLSVILTNTSSGIADLTASHNLLTGLGFNLPNGVYISFGTAMVASGSNTLGFTGANVSGEWGYDNSPLDSGPFQTAPAGVAASSVNTTITTMEASTTSAFSDVPVLSPDGLAGPEFGLLSGNVGADVAGGLAAIQDTILFDVSLSGLGDYLLANPNFDILSWIDEQDVVLSFGSPGNTSTSVPEPAGFLLMSMGLIGLFLARRRRLM